MTDDLATRAGLPPELLGLLDTLPRADWPAHPRFHGLTSFWLDRHMAFRHLLARIRHETEALADHRADPASFPQRLIPLGRRLVDELVGHHQIEDQSYFPELLALEPRLAHGFDILDADHHALDALLDGFVTGANALLQAPDRVAGASRFHASLAPFSAQLERHLGDEEDLVLPIILKHGLG